MLHKQPDFEAMKAGKKFQVECKRLAKTTGYSECERLEWIKRWKYLQATMQGLGVSCHADITFNVPIDSVPEDGLVKIFVDYVEAGYFETGTLIKTGGIDFQAKPIDMARVTAHFSKSIVRLNSPQFVSLLADGYIPYMGYTNAFRPSEIFTCGPDDGLHALNDFVGGLHEAYSAKWECIAPESIEKKAKDVRTILSKAVAQIPDNESGIVHIGYETLNGPIVEFRRYNKIIETVNDFDYGNKKIQSIFFNALQPMSSIESFECAETTAYFGAQGIKPEEVLPDMLLLGPPNLETRLTTHWLEDYLSKNS